MIVRRAATLRSLWHTYRLDLLASFLLGMAALLVRLPYWQLIPIFYDEGLEVLWGWEIALGQHFPLTNIDTYYGPIFPYWMALLFRVLGPHLFLARGLTIGLGALTAVATYWLASPMFNRWAGLGAGILTATSPYLIITSHYGWSNSLTPFFTVLTLGVFYRGVKSGQARWLAVSGLLAAFMLQTHPLTLVVLAGMVLWYLGQGPWRAQLGRPAVYAALALFLVGYAPMFVANLPSDVPLLRAANTHTYAFEPTADPAVYLERLELLIRRIAYSLVGQTVRQVDETTWGVVAGALAAAAGLGYALRRGGGLLVAVSLSTLACLPLILRNYGFDLSRYVMFLLPLLFTAIGGLGAEVGIRTAAWLAPPARPRLARWLAAGMLGACLLGTTVLSLWNLKLYFDFELVAHRTNQPLLDFGARLAADGACQKELWMQEVEPELVNRDTPAWFLYHSLRYLLTMRGCKFAVTNAERIKMRLAGEQEHGWLLTLKQDAVDYTGPLHLEPVETIVPNSSGTDEFVLYRVTPGKP